MSFKLHLIDKSACTNPAFIEYYNKCLVYNYISDLMKENPESAIMYWDSKNEAIAFKFPSNGSIAKHLLDLGEVGNEESDFWK